MKKLIALIFILLSIAFGAYSQTTLDFVCTTKQPQSERDFKKWVNEYVRYIITKNEKEDFLKLKTEEEQNAFIERFWTKRDPDLDTAENEFQKEYCERIGETDQFESGIPGWRTDRGWIYIIFGKPDKIIKGRKDFENLKKIVFENWFYKSLDGIGSNIEFTFFDPTENKGFRLPKEKREKILRFTESGLRTCYNCPENPF
jgi:GWxTD domain-containing protein